MPKIDLYDWIPLAIGVLGFAFGLVQIQLVKALRRNKVIRWSVLTSILSLLLAVLVVSGYYERRQSETLEKIHTLDNSSIVVTDSVLTSIQGKDATYNKLIALQNQLKILQENLRKQERIIGPNPLLKEKIDKTLDVTETEIGKIESYNDPIVLPIYLDSGYSMSEDVRSFNFACPVDSTSEYVDVKVSFKDPKLWTRISCMFIEIIEMRPTGPDGKEEQWIEFRQAYNPRPGINAFRIKNYIKSQKHKLYVGYFLKGETNTKFPEFNKRSCFY